MDSAIELGCGGGFLLNSVDLSTEFEGLEITKAAVEYLRERYENKVYQSDILSFSSSKSWDLVLDAHLLHCLIGLDDFKKYFQVVERLLNHGGHLLLEVMCHSRAMEFDAGQFFDNESSILYSGERPIRTILTSREIEQIIIESGLKIVYLRVDENIKFIPNSHRSESRPSDPDRLRVICLKE